MMNKKYQFTLFFLIACLVGWSLVVLTYSASADLPSDLPPRATPIPTPTLAAPTPTPAPAPAQPNDGNGGDGARLQMEATFSQAWPWDQMHWQDLWTVVQWYDGMGNWYDVEGWRGNLDNVTQQDTTWIGQKEWWVIPKDLGTGPFRWLVYQSRDGRLLATSEPFNLPDTSGKATIVSVSLQP